MAFCTNDLSVLAYANGFTLWSYRTDDAAGDRNTDAYFDPAHTLLCRGDMILANFGPRGLVFRVTESAENRVRVAVMCSA